MHRYGSRIAEKKKDGRVKGKVEDVRILVKTRQRVSVSKYWVDQKVHTGLV